jgi:hypothetical protein
VNGQRLALVAERVAPAPAGATTRMPARIWSGGQADNAKA